MISIRANKILPLFFLGDFMKYLKCFSTFILAVFFAVCSVTFCYADNSGSPGGSFEPVTLGDFQQLVNKMQTFTFHDYAGNEVTVQWQGNGYYFDGYFFRSDSNMLELLAEYLQGHVKNKADTESFKNWFKENKDKIVDLTSLIPCLGGVISNRIGRLNSDEWTDYQPQQGGLSDVGKAIDDKIKNGVIKFVNGTLNISKDIMTELRNKAIVQYYGSIGADVIYPNRAKFDSCSIDFYKKYITLDWQKFNKDGVSIDDFNNSLDNSDFIVGYDSGFYSINRKKYAYAYVDSHQDIIDINYLTKYDYNIKFVDSKLNDVTNTATNFFVFSHYMLANSVNMVPYDHKVYPYLSGQYSRYGKYSYPVSASMINLGEYYSDYYEPIISSIGSSHSEITFSSAGNFFKNANTMIVIFHNKRSLIAYLQSKHNTYATSKIFEDIKDDINISNDQLKDINSKMDSVINAINNADKSNMSADDIQKLVDGMGGKLDDINSSIDDNGGKLDDVNNNINASNAWLEKIYNELKVQESLLQQILGVSSDISNEVEMQTYIDEVNSITLTDNIKNEFKNVGNEMKNHFPFSAPWDLQIIYSSLVADESPPKFVFDYSFMYNNWLGGSDDTTHELIIDFKDYQMLSDISKGLLSLLFLYGLIQLTQKFIFKEVG